MHEYETWTLAKDSEWKLRCSQCTVLGMVFGPIIGPINNFYRIQKNRELSEFYADPDMVKKKQNIETEMCMTYLTDTKLPYGQIGMEDLSLR